MEPKLRPLANQPKQLGYLMTRSSCWAVAFALQALVLPVLGIARDGQVCESSGGRSVTFTTRSEEQTSALQSLMRISYAVIYSTKYTCTTNTHLPRSRTARTRSNTPSKRS